MNTDDRRIMTDEWRPTSPFGKLQMAISQQCVIRSSGSTSCLVLGCGFLGQRIERCHFRSDQIQD